MKQLTFITGNADKATWTQRYLKQPLSHHKLDLPEIQSLDAHEVVEYKVKEAYKILHQPVLVEDTSLVFNTLGKLPGTLIKWFISELGNEGLCKLINTDDRTAVATVLFGYYDGNKVLFGEGNINGTITKSPRGTNGFGWDPIFIPDGQTKTHAELTPEEIILVDKKNGLTQVKQVKGFDLHGLRMDEALLTNTLGGGIPW